MTESELTRAIWKIAPLWVGGPTSDVEVRAILKIAQRIRGFLAGRYDGRYGPPTKYPASIVAAAAVHEYYMS